MQTTRWNKKRVIIILIIILFIYLIFSASYNKYEIDGTIPNTKPEKVWEFVADFSKMRLLNPTILDFQITADHGNVHHWKYSVIYREKLSHWPHWINEAYGNYNVKQLNQSDGGDYIVESDHKTCFFGGFYCLHSSGEFKFSPIGNDTYCLETVHYQCPPFLGSFCRREVEYQRRAIMKNLTLQFQKKD